jgi:hypothetical protein
VGTTNIKKEVVKDENDDDNDEDFSLSTIAKKKRIEEVGNVNPVSDFNDILERSIEGGDESLIEKVSVLSCRVVPCYVVSCRVNLTLPCLVLSCPCCPVLSCPVLSCPV